MQPFIPQPQIPQAPIPSSITPCLFLRKYTFLWPKTSTLKLSLAIANQVTCQKCKLTQSPKASRFRTRVPKTTQHTSWKAKARTISEKLHLSCWIHKLSGNSHTWMSHTFTSQSLLISMTANKDGLLDGFHLLGMPTLRIVCWMSSAPTFLCCHMAEMGRSKAWR